MNLTKTLIDVAVPAAFGAASQYADQMDAKKMVEFAAISGNAGKKYAEYKKIGNYVAFVPLAVGIVGSVSNILPISKDWTDKALMIGSVLAGQKAVQMLTKKHYKLSYSEAGYANAEGRVYPRAAGYRGYTPPTPVHVVQNGVSGELAASATGMGSL